MREINNFIGLLWSLSKSILGSSFIYRIFSVFIYLTRTNTRLIMQVFAGNWLHKSFSFILLEDTLEMRLK